MESLDTITTPQKRTDTADSSMTAPSISRRAKSRKRDFLPSPYQTRMLKIITECWRIDARTLWQMVGGVKNTFGIEIKRLVGAGYIQEIPIKVGTLHVFLPRARGTASSWPAGIPPPPCSRSAWA